jgi:Ran GTPase-activating protein (RanGAP) involved in mRNA processing and transport
MQSLNLEKNNIGDIGVKVLCEGVEYSRSLIFLNLNHNCITDLGARSIADMLKYNTSLRALFISWNKIK